MLPKCGTSLRMRFRKLQTMAATLPICSQRVWRWRSVLSELLNVLHGLIIAVSVYAGYKVFLQGDADAE